MYGNTLTPLFQFTNWLGIEPYQLAGIDLDYANRAINKKTQGDNCDCYFQHGWDSGKHWSRDELVEMLRMAEEFFIAETDIYPAPMQIYSERHSLKNRGSIINNKGEYKSVRPLHPIYVNYMGIKKLTHVDDYPVVKLDGGDISDVFTVSFTLSGNYSVDALRFYFISSDCLSCQLDATIDYNSRECEIRPIKCITRQVNGIDETSYDYVVSFYPYTLKKPSLNDFTDCLEHVSATYVDEIAVYVEEYENVNGGGFVVYNNNCSNLPCGSTFYESCVQERVVGHNELWAVPKNYIAVEQEGGSYIYQTICVLGTPTEYLLNYNSGRPMLDSREISKDYMDIIGKLAIVFADCIKEFCKCDVCLTKKVQHYRSVPVIKEREGERLGDYDNYYQSVLDRIALRFADGLVPYRGTIEAARAMYKFKKTNVEGAYFG